MLVAATQQLQKEDVVRLNKAANVVAFAVFFLIYKPVAFSICSG